MSRFTQKEEPLGRFIGAGTFQLEEEMVYWEGADEGEGFAIRVPKGFVTDFASIPRIFLNILPKLDTHRRAAILHDYLYATEGIGIYSRAKCDSIFLEAMKVLGVPFMKRWAMYLAVRSGGFKAWDYHLMVSRTRRLLEYKLANQLPKDT